MYMQCAHASQANVTASENIAQVGAKVLTAADMLCKEDTCTLVMEVWPRRVDACYEAGGSHFEHSLRSGKAYMHGDASEPADAESECEVLEEMFVDAEEADESDFEVPDAFEEGEEVDAGSEPGADEAHGAVPEMHACAEASM